MFNTIKVIPLIPDQTKRTEVRNLCEIKVTALHSSAYKNPISDVGGAWTSPINNKMASLNNTLPEHSQICEDSIYTDSSGDTFPRLASDRPEAAAASSRIESRPYRQRSPTNNPLTPPLIRGQQQQSYANITPSATYRTFANQKMPDDDSSSEHQARNPMIEYYDKHFTLRGYHKTPRKEVMKTSPFLVELQTNVRVSHFFRISIVLPRVSDY